MRYLVIFLLFLMIVATAVGVFAAPTNADTAQANGLINSLENSQPNYKSIYKKYEQVLPRMTKDNKLVYWMDEYKGECGVGYIITIEKVIDYKRWIKQKHVGCEDRTVYTDWTQTN